MIYLNSIVKLEVTNDSSPSRSSSIPGPTVQTRGDIDAQVKQGDMGGNPTFLAGKLEKFGFVVDDLLVLTSFFFFSEMIHNH
jgi:hypothetical protein